MGQEQAGRKAGQVVFIGIVDGQAHGCREQADPDEGKRREDVQRHQPRDPCHQEIADFRQMRDTPFVDMRDHDSRDHEEHVHKGVHTIHQLTRQSQAPGEVDEDDADRGNEAHQVEMQEFVAFRGEAEDARRCTDAGVGGVTQLHQASFRTAD